MPGPGTNSHLKRNACDDLKRGDRVRVTWWVPNVFSDGLHQVEVAITDRQGLTVYDWWQDAASFTVVKKKPPYIVTPDATFSFERARRLGMHTSAGLRSGATRGKPE